MVLSQKVLPLRLGSVHGCRFLTPPDLQCVAFNKKVRVASRACHEKKWPRGFVLMAADGEELTKEMLYATPIVLSMMRSSGSLSRTVFLKNWDQASLSGFDKWGHTWIWNAHEGTGSINFYCPLRDRSCISINIATEMNLPQNDPAYKGASSIAFSMYTGLIW